MNYISIQGLTVSYGAGPVLEDVNLDIAAGDFLGVIGPNGGGKSTLVKAITGTLPQNAHVKGDIIYSDELKHNKKRIIGYLPQQNDFDKSFPITVGEVALSGLQTEVGLWGRYGKEHKRRAQAAMEMTGVNDLHHCAIGEISGGQLQRTLLARALVSQPRVLILDEPANFVDNRFEGELYRLLQQLNEKMAIVMVSHDVGTISSVVKNIVCVNRQVHRHFSNKITIEQLENYRCPIQLVSHGHIPHTVLEKH